MTDTRTTQLTLIAKDMLEVIEQHDMGEMIGDPDKVLASMIDWLSDLPADRLQTASLHDLASDFMLHDLAVGYLTTFDDISEEALAKLTPEQQAAIRWELTGQVPDQDPPEDQDVGQRNYEMSHNMSDLFDELNAHPRDCNCHACDGHDPADDDVEVEPLAVLHYSAPETVDIDFLHRWADKVLAYQREMGVADNPGLSLSEQYPDEELCPEEDLPIDPVPPADAEYVLGLETIDGMTIEIRHYVADYVMNCIRYWGSHVDNHVPYCWDNIWMGITEIYCHRMEGHDPHNPHSLHVAMVGNIPVIWADDGHTTDALQQLETNLYVPSVGEMQAAIDHERDVQRYDFYDETPATMAQDFGEDFTI